ncbi:MAG: hypothetical protein KJ771_08965, partial [Nanoarchaeota archaeon]|nr:hypothetical protein [Nanoarchaeota archaeon]
MGAVFTISLNEKNAGRVDKLRKRFRFFYNPSHKLWFATERAASLARKMGIDFQINSEIDSSQSNVKI